MENQTWNVFRLLYAINIHLWLALISILVQLVIELLWRGTSLVTFIGLWTKWYIVMFSTSKYYFYYSDFWQKLKYSRENIQLFRFRFHFVINSFHASTHIAPLSFYEALLCTKAKLKSINNNNAAWQICTVSGSKSIGFIPSFQKLNNYWIPGHSIWRKRLFQ